MSKDWKQKYDECNTCAEHKTDKAQAHNENSNEDIFKNFLLGQRLEIDYVERGNQNYLLIVCVLIRFIQMYKTANKSTSEALKCLRAWVANWGLTYSVKYDPKMWGW